MATADRGRRCWKGQVAVRNAVYANRRRIRGERGRRLLRCRGELLERPFAHVYETGGMRRVHLRGHPNIRKRLLVQVAGYNLGLLLRHLTPVGTPRSLHGRAAALSRALCSRFRGLWSILERVRALLTTYSSRTTHSRSNQSLRTHRLPSPDIRNGDNRRAPRCGRRGRQKMHDARLIAMAARADR